MKNPLLFLFSIGLLVPFMSFAQFPDVSDSHTHVDAISFVKSQGIVNGYPDGTFQPDALINRAEFTKIMIESAFTSADITSCNTNGVGLSDVSANQWFAPYVCVAKQNGVIGGYPDGTFKGANNVNFAEGAKIVAETFNLSVGAEGSQWFDKYITAISNAGATPRTGIAATANLTRGEMAEMIYSIKSDTSAMEDKTQEDVEAVEAAVSNIPALPAYVAYSPELYATLREQNVPFILNLSASWCPNCQALDAKLQNEIQNLPAGTLVLEADYDAETELKREFNVTTQTSGVLFAEDGSTETLNGRLNYNAIEDFFADMDESAMNMFSQQASLSPQGDFIATGVAQAGFANSEYKVVATFDNLPTAPAGFFYEGWIVRQGANLSVISTGEAVLLNGQYVNEWTSNEDLTDHLLYVLTIEPDDGDPAPADHVTEGPFQAL